MLVAVTARYIRELASVELDLGPSLLLVGAAPRCFVRHLCWLVRDSWLMVARVKDLRWPTLGFWTRDPSDER